MTQLIKIRIETDLFLKKSEDGYFLEYKDIDQDLASYEVAWDAADPDVIAAGINDWTEDDWDAAIEDAADLALVMERTGGPFREVTLDELAEL